MPLMGTAREARGPQDNFPKPSAANLVHLCLWKGELKGGRR